MKTLLIFILTAFSTCAQTPYFDTLRAVAAQQAKPASGGGGGSIAIVQCQQLATGDGSGSITLSPTTAGNLLVVGVTVGGGSPTPTIPTVSSGTFIQATNTPYVTSLGAIYIFYLKNISASLTSISCGSTSGGNGLTAIAYEISGCSTTAPFTSTEAVTNFVGTTSTPNPATLSLANGTANSIEFAFMSDDEGADPISATLNGTGTVGTWGYFNSNAEQLNDNDLNDLVCATSIITTTTTQKQVWTCAFPQQWNTVAIAFHQ